MGYVKDKYDVTLNQSIWDACISDESDTYYTYNLIPVCITGFTDTSSQCEEEDNYVNYQNFQAITNVSFNREVKNGRIDGLSGFAKLNIASGVATSADAMSGAVVSMGQGGVLSDASWTVIA